ncbi:MAG TPA: Xaa-Pro peptidase family protein [Thermoanaerobaculia bacterium]|nr:Xaa-Pro peptidase family protein [Thermoanaerobaculia bacterium]
MNERIQRLQEELARRQIDALVLNPGPTLRYLTHHEFASHERLFLLTIPASGTPMAVVPKLEASNWREAVPEVERILLWDDSEGPDHAAAQAFSHMTAAKRVAIEPLCFRYFEYSHLKRHLPHVEVVSADAAVQTLRLYKSAEEAGFIREAARIAEESLETVLAGVRPGRTEREIAASLSSELLARGGGGISFGPIVLSGARSALPHGVPEDRAIGAGELLLVDFGTSVHGYHSDITRTFVVGAEPDDETRRVYEAVKQANASGRRAAKPGATAHEVHHLCQADLTGPEWQGWTTHRTGHGLGLEIHEPPSIMHGSRVELRTGMVFTVEPGLYRDGWGGVRIEDDVWLTDDGCESLTTFGRDLRVVGV